MPRPAYGLPATAAEVRAMSSALQTAFAVDRKGVGLWIRKAGPSNFRVERAGRAVVACLNLIPMGQWFGGRRVSMTGVAGVAVPPEHRARGHASALMRGAVREMAADGVALSGLYPATQPVYRRVGYEQAGTRTVYTLPVPSIDGRDREGEIRAAGPRDRGAIRRLYGAWTAASSGLLDRTDYMWWRAFGRGEEGYRTYLVIRGGRTEGYFVLRQEKRPAGPPYDLWLHDFAFATPAAGRRMLSFLAAHRSLAGDLHWTGGPADALFLLLAEPALSVKWQMRWMVRITDLRRAVEERGYPSGLAAEAHLEVRDPLVAKNDGPWTIRVAGGRGRAVRGGRGTVKAEISALGPVYTGFRSPLEQRISGGVLGPDRDLAALGAMFAGPAPWNREMY